MNNAEDFEACNSKLEIFEPNSIGNGSIVVRCGLQKDHEEEIFYHQATFMPREDWTTPTTWWHVEWGHEQDEVSPI